MAVAQYQKESSVSYTSLDESEQKSYIRFVFGLFAVGAIGFSVSFVGKSSDAVNLNAFSQIDDAVLHHLAANPLPAPEQEPEIPVHIEKPKSNDRFTDDDRYNLKNIPLVPETESEKLSADASKTSGQYAVQPDKIEKQPVHVDSQSKSTTATGSEKFTADDHQTLGDYAQDSPGKTVAGFDDKTEKKQTAPVHVQKQQQQKRSNGRFNSEDSKTLADYAKDAPGKTIAGFGEKNEEKQTKPVHAQQQERKSNGKFTSDDSKTLGDLAEHSPGQTVAGFDDQNEKKQRSRPVRAQQQKPKSNGKFTAADR